MISSRVQQWILYMTWLSGSRMYFGKLPTLSKSILKIRSMVLKLFSLTIFHTLLLEYEVAFNLPLILRKLGRMCMIHVPIKMARNMLSLRLPFYYDSCKERDT